MDEGMAREAARELVFAIAGGDIRDVDGRLMRDGRYFRPAQTDSEIYAISQVEDYRFHISTRKFDNIIPNGGTDIIAYREFARQLRRLEDEAA